MPMVSTTKPTSRGAKLADGAKLRASNNAKTHNTNSAVPTIWSIRPPGNGGKKLYGYVAQMPAVPWGPRTCRTPPSKLCSISQWACMPRL